MSHSTRWYALLGIFMAYARPLPSMKKPAVATLLVYFLTTAHLVDGELFCGARSYASADNTGCSACPTHSARLLQDPATAAGANSTVADCLCEEGFYDARDPSSSFSGALCEACPPGATCDGLRAPPRALAGFWRLADPNAEPRADELFWPCAPWHACDSTAAAAFVAEESAALASDGYGDAGDGSHLNETTKCAGHRTGTRCDGIASGFRLVGSGAYELACVPAVGRSFAGSLSHGACIHCFHPSSSRGVILTLGYTHLSGVIPRSLFNELISILRLWLLVNVPL